LFFDELLATAIVPGDGEYILCNILTTLREKKSLEEIDGVITKQTKMVQANIVKNLDELPFPIRSKPQIAKDYQLSIRRELFNGNFATMVTSRGCQYKCPFASQEY